MFPYFHLESDPEPEQINFLVLFIIRIYKQVRISNNVEWNQLFITRNGPGIRHVISGIRQDIKFICLNIRGIRSNCGYLVVILIYNPPPCRTNMVHILNGLTIDSLCARMNEKFEKSNFNP